MKDLITSIASLMLLMIFVMQFANNQAIYTEIVGVASSVREFRDAAEEEGEITYEDVSELKQSAAYRLGCSPDEIGFSSEETEAGNAEYDLAVPLKGIVASAKLLGISDSENEAEYHFRGVVIGKDEEEEEKEEGEAGEQEQDSEREQEKDTGTGGESSPAEPEQPGEGDQT
jgi:hypothetical protein